MIKNEEDSFNLYAKSYDEDDEPSTPTTARYKIECLTSGRNIRAWTTLTPAQSMLIAVEPDDNAIVYNANRLERRQLTVQTDFDTVTQKVKTIEWDVRNLQ
jgi:hypothetical protein